MGNEWYDEHYIGFDKILLSGQNVNGEAFELTLTEEQKELLYNFNFDQAQDKKHFFRELLRSED